MALRLASLAASCVFCGAIASAIAAGPPIAMPSDRLHDTPLAVAGNDEAPAPRFDAFYAGMVESLPPPQRAERALELAVNGYAGAADYVIRQAPSWRGRIEGGDRLAAMVSAAMNSPRIDVRMAGLEVQLAQDGVGQTPQDVDHLVARLREDPKGVGPWMLWHLGALGARGVERRRVFDVLAMHSRSSDESLRRWSVEALNLFGGAEAIDPLLGVAARDPSATIRERAFCGLAQSGTFQPAERRLAVPGLFAIATDLRADRQQVDWAYQALREITGVRDLPQQPASWRERLQRLGLLQPRIAP